VRATCQRGYFKGIKKMKKRIFEAPSGQRIETVDKHDIAMVKKCGWREIKKLEIHPVFQSIIENQYPILKERIK
jgi:hypothetical protein